MAMTLKLKTVPVHTGSDGLPDFMVWNNVTELPWFWVPFQSQTFGIVAGILVPTLFAALQYPLLRRHAPPGSALHGD